MRILVSGATKTVRELAADNGHHLGHLLTPTNGNSIDSLLKTGLPVACDNAAYSDWCPARFCKLLSQVAGKPLLWVACPDVVGDARATWRLYNQWGPVIKSMGLPVAFVAQDGTESCGLPIDTMDALFVGGSTDWKMGEDAMRAVRIAKQFGKSVHFGRVNTLQRLRYAHELGCDSVDGSGYSAWPGVNLPPALEHLDYLDRQSSLLAA